MQDIIELWNNQEMVNKIHDEQLSHLVFHRDKKMNMVKIGEKGLKEVFF